jgi:hypothetical protein
LLPWTVTLELVPVAVTEKKSPAMAGGEKRIIAPAADTRNAAITVLMLFPMRMVTFL